MSAATATEEPAAYQGSPPARRGAALRAATPAASGSSTTSAKRPSSAPVLALAASAASSPMSSGPRVAEAMSDPASAPSARAASPPASATSPTAATSVEDRQSASTPSRTGLSNRRLSTHASGTSARKGASDTASTAEERVRRSHSACGAIPSAVSTTSTASSRSPRVTICSEGASRARATAARAKGSSAPATRSATRCPVISRSLTARPGAEVARLWRYGRPRGEPFADRSDREMQSGDGHGDHGDPGARLIELVDDFADVERGPRQRDDDDREQEATSQADPAGRQRCEREAFEHGEHHQWRGLHIDAEQPLGLVMFRRGFDVARFAGRGRLGPAALAVGARGLAAFAAGLLGVRGGGFGVRVLAGPFGDHADSEQRRGSEEQCDQRPAQRAHRRGKPVRGGKTARSPAARSAGPGWRG